MPKDPGMMRIKMYLDHANRKEAGEKEAARRVAQDINRKHKELYKNTEDYLAKRHVAKEHENPYWQEKK